MSKINKVLEAMGNKIFTVTFTKKDGSTRVLNGRRGVRKGLNGVGMKYNPAEKGLITVYDLKVKDYRSVKVDTVTQVKSHNKIWNF
jgi:hypothetical protein